MKCFLFVSNFLEEISSLSHSIVFLYFLALITGDGILSLLALPWNSAFRWEYFPFSPLPLASLLLSAICKASSDSHFAIFHFFFLGVVLIPASCSVSGTSIHSSSDTLLDLIHFRYKFLILTNTVEQFSPRLCAVETYKVLPWYEDF